VMLNISSWSPWILAPSMIHISCPIWSTGALITRPLVNRMCSRTKYIILVPKSQLVKPWVLFLMYPQKQMPPTRNTTSTRWKILDTIPVLIHIVAQITRSSDPTQSIITVSHMVETQSGLNITRPRNAKHVQLDNGALQAPMEESSSAPNTNQK